MHIQTSASSTIRVNPWNRWSAQLQKRDSSHTYSNKYVATYWTRAQGRRRGVGTSSAWASSLTSASARRADSFWNAVRYLEDPFDEDSAECATSSNATFAVLSSAFVPASSA
jgi:hypothetical protein